LPSWTEILPLLPGLRRFAAGLACCPDPASRRETDKVVLRAVHKVLRDPLVDSGPNLRAALYGALVRLQQGRAETKSTAGTDLAPALLALPFGHRAALLLVALEGFSYEEAATALGLNRHIVLGRLTTARQMLSQHFDARLNHGVRQASHLRLVK
jgi:DNA-directed RNA polymerase specialized sigma24 family protein